MVQKRFFFVLAGVLLMALLTAAGCGGSPVSEPPAGRTETPVLSSTPTPTPTLLTGGLAASTPQVSPTPLCAALELEIDYRQVQQAEDFFAEMTAQGRIPLTLDLYQTPPQVKGSGEAGVGGGGNAGNCTFVYSGSLEYDLHGELLLDRQPPVIALSGKRGSRNLSASGPGCYGGLLSPFMTDDVPLFEIEYRDGATLKYSFDMPTFHGEAVWTLDFRCP